MKPIHDILSSIGISFPGDHLRKYASEKPPLRSELFNTDQMEMYGKSLAIKHKIVTRRAPNRLLIQLANNEEVLVDVHTMLTEVVKQKHPIAPAGEWLLDNFYLIQEQIRIAKKHLPKEYSEDLPQIKSGASAGLPRVYDIAAEIISHSDGRLDVHNLTRFVTAYQSITPLNLGELWAIPIMLRLALIENLRRLGAQLALDKVYQDLASYWAEKMINTAQQDPKNLILVIADMTRSDPPMVSAFVAELTRHLQGQGPTLSLPLTWIEQRLFDSGQNIQELVNTQTQKQAVDQISMSNSINSLRFLGTTDWKEFVETTSIVEEILREDIGAVYPRMDFYTRDLYRHVIERIAKNSDKSERDVAKIAIRLAKTSYDGSKANDRTSHVGYYLIDKGLTLTEKAANVKLPFNEKLKKVLFSQPLVFYLGAIFIITIALTGVLFLKAYFENVSTWVLLLTTIMVLIGTSQFAVTLINWLSTIFIKPRILPRMDFSFEIPSESRTLVVIPTLISTKEDIMTLTELLELHYLSNRSKNLHFCLLTDFKDADRQTLPEDEELIQLIQERIKNLNEKFGSLHNEIFFLFHRPRKWEPRDKIWMGYERKRGKLTELNELLRGNGEGNFSVIIGKNELFPNIKYVVTIDADTQLPRDSVLKIIATMAHPLNCAYYNDKKQRVTQGYGILQPRVELSLKGANYSLFTKLHSNNPGIDPYTRTTSDVYQDIFNEGSFIGKGIYEVETFGKALNDRFPENRILSHDLLEGCYTRSGLVSDVTLYEEHPASYLDDANRRHRWIRGDWQIAAWIFPKAPGPGKRSLRNPLSALSRWKIFDNLRRSFVAPGILILIILGWTVLKDAWFWTLIAFSIILLPFLITSTRDIIRRPREISLKQHVKDSIHGIKNNFLQTLFNFICLPHEAFYSLHAIFVTAWRIFITKKNLLQWNPSHYKQHQDKKLAATYLIMWPGPAIGLAGLSYLSVYEPIYLIVAFPVAVLWMLSPAIAWLVSQPLRKTQYRLSADQYLFLRKKARKTWRFFEDFVGDMDNWLPPDNYQEYPVERIAHRTSPTNIGVYLLSNLAATDFGYITKTIFLERISKTFQTLQRMERYRGHFYNWYDTVTLEPLPPLYVSSVDSGNFAAHVLTLRQGILEVKDQKIIGPASFEGLKDTLQLIKESLKKDSLVLKFEEELNKKTGLETLNPYTLKKHLEILLIIAETISTSTIAESEEAMWADELVQQCQDSIDELLKYLPWLTLSKVPATFRDILPLDEIPTLNQLATIGKDLSLPIKECMKAAETPEDRTWIDQFRKSIFDAERIAQEQIENMDSLADECINFSRLEYDFLYDKSQNLIAIGFNAEENRKDPSHYDLLASEARLCIFLGIAQGKLPQESWFSLGRQLTNPGGGTVLLSWSGSMFEYLMPHLVMPVFENTLIDQTNKAMVERQIEFGRQRDVPWGISESGYNMVDGSLNYQYRAFGITGLGLKRGLSEDLVVSPYSTILALMVKPEEAYHNLKRLTEEKFEGKFGYFEAIDYTTARLPRKQSHVVVRSFMAHHQGMSLVALDNVLLDRPMQRRFEAEPRFQATILLLQERIPKDTGYYTPPEDVAEISIVSITPQMRVINTPQTPVPDVQLLSNGKYHVMITNAGGGYSRWKHFGVTRWQEDYTCDNWGIFCFVKDLEKNVYWSTTGNPNVKTPKNYEAVFSQGRAEFRRKDEDLETHTEIVVSPEDDIEIRRVHITNRSRKKRFIEVTSYAEVVLNDPRADILHPAFNKLFIQTELIPQRNAILGTRRPRSAEEHPPWMFHLMKARNAAIEDVSYETDRMKFIGRANSVEFSHALVNDGPLSGSEGPVLDPIVSIRYRMTINPLESITVDLVFGMGDNREIAEGLVEKYQDAHFSDRAFGLAWTHSQVVLRQINATESDAQLYGRMAGSIIYANTFLRADPSILLRNHRGQSGLWGYSISGDLPIVLAQIESPSNIFIIKQLIQAHTYWRLKGLIVDLVIWNEDHGGYRQLLQNQLYGLISTDVYRDVGERPGGIFVRVADQISPEDRILIQSVARIIIMDKKGTLEYQLGRRQPARAIIPLLLPRFTYARQVTNLPVPAGLIFYNGTGGFSPDGKEYVITIHKTKPTPLPWINVLANHKFGTIISESGQSYTWEENAHEFRLTPWYNDPVTDPGGEIYYLRDDETGYYWSPTLLPVSGESNYVVHHGFGYSTYEHIEDGIYSEMTVFVHPDESVKFIVFKVQNRSGRERKISVYGFIEWVLGDLREKSSMHVITEVDKETGTLIAKNQYNKEFDNRICYFDVNDDKRTLTGDRTEFIGRNGTLRNPEALKKVRLSGKTGAGLDPCGALQVGLDLADQQEHEIVFLLGTGRHARDAKKIIDQYRLLPNTLKVLQNVKEKWQKLLGRVQVETPDQSLNILANGWLLYQTLSCRMWARTGYYQSGGAFGFRDQLQDVTALMYTDSQLARKQILLSASRQFREGDVQHWWHPPTGRGVRTRCSDDFLWLPYVTCRYVNQTGDTGILDENVHFLEGRLVNPNEESYYDLPVQSDQTGTLYDHCVLAIKNGLKFGEHGLPLIGTGDWNDGMDKVGHEGRGESVWLGFFLYSILGQFSEIATSRGDLDFAEECREMSELINNNIENNAWDGEWYRRAWFDDGTPLGSSSNAECSIDSISQSWSVLSGRRVVERSRIALDSAYKRLVRKDLSIIQLLDPPFDKSDLNPGYIKGYVPGVRENGGQYTHAAIWLIMAFAALKDKERTWELFKLINPINHGKTSEEISTYMVEPFVVAADVYTVSQHTGRGGWTWYTGSAGWLYRLILESIIGLRIENNKLSFSPCIPSIWKSFTVHYKHLNTVYHIRLIQAETEETMVSVDGNEFNGNTVNLSNDGIEHVIEIKIPIGKEGYLSPANP